jgi:hypothetical protein
MAIALMSMVLALSLLAIPFGHESYHPEDAGILTIFGGLAAAVVGVVTFVFALILRAVKVIDWKLPVVVVCLLVVAGACVCAGRVTSENTCNGSDYTRYRCGTD